MPPFRVMLEGAPVFVLDESSEKTNRFGFYTTRWVQAPSADEAKAVAIRAAFEELAVDRRNDPRDGVDALSRVLVVPNSPHTVRQMACGWSNPAGG